MDKKQKSKSQWYSTNDYDEINYQQWTDGKVSSPDYKKAYDRMMDDVDKSKKNSDTGEE